MTRTEFRAARLLLGLTEKEMAEARGVSARTIWNDQHSVFDVPKAVELAVNAMLKEHEENMARVR